MTRVLRGGLDDVAGDDGEVVDPQDAFGLYEQAVDEPEVAAGDAADGGDGLGVGEVGQVQGEAELASVAAQDERELVVAERPVLVGEADAAEELGGAGQSLVDAGHPDQEQPEGPSIEAVAQVLQGRCGQLVGLVDDEQVDVARRRAGEVGLVAANVLVDAGLDALKQHVEVLVELARVLVVVGV